MIGVPCLLLRATGRKSGQPRTNSLVYARARELGKDDPDYARLWKIANDGNRGRYDQYQTRTSRAIPVVVLTPV